jgi:magnesium transporter
MSQCQAVARLADGAAREIDPSTIDELLRDHRSVLWLDVQDPTDDDIDLLRREFGFHELALEDALRGRQRPKVDGYGDYYFIVIYSAAVDDGHIATREIHCFWGKDYLVTLHAGRCAEIDAAIQRWKSTREQQEYGVAFQAYAFFDAVLDGYFPVLDVIAEQMEDIEERIFEGRGDTSLVREVFALRKQLIDTRRVLAPSRDVLNEIIRRDVAVFPQELVPYLADVYDHAIRVIDTLDLHRELLSSAIETHLSVTSNRLNQTMRTLTALTIGIMVPTMLAGVYGMNYRLMPDNDEPWGFTFAIALMAVSFAGTLFSFWRLGWLGR